MLRTVSGEVAQRLRDLARDGAYATRAGHLAALATAVEGGAEAAVWAETDLLRALDVEGPVAGVVAESERSRQLELLRTALIFCPLVVTWIGLYLASGAYRDLTRSDATAADQPFLKLWLDGFHGHTFFSLGRLALSSAVLIALLVLASVLLERQRQSDDVTFETVSAEKREALRSAAVDAQLALAHHRLSSPERYREEITRSSAAFGEVVQQVTAITQSITGSLAELGRVAERLDAASAQTARGATEIAAATTGLPAALDRTTSELSRQVETSSSWVVGAADALLRQSEANVNAATRNFDAVSRSVTTMHERLEEAGRRDARVAELLHASERATAEVTATRDAIALLADAVAKLATRPDLTSTPPPAPASAASSGDAP